ARAIPARWPFPVVNHSRPHRWPSSRSGSEQKPHRTVTPPCGFTSLPLTGDTPANQNRRGEMQQGAMMDDKQIGTGIVASILTGTIATIPGGIVLNCITPTSPGNPGDKPPAIENKPPPPKVGPAPFESQPVPQPPVPPAVPLPVPPSDPQTLNTLRDQLAAQ